jgi:hypothetical protein
MLNRKPGLEQVHISLTNQDIVNCLIHKEREKEHPWRTDFPGVQYLMRKENATNPCIHRTQIFDDG